MAYDPKCYDLAEYFLGRSSERLLGALSQHIQDAIEDWLNGERDRLVEEEQMQDRMGRAP